MTLQYCIAKLFPLCAASRKEQHTAHWESIKCQIEAPAYKIKNCKIWSSILTSIWVEQSRNSSDFWITCKIRATTYSVLLGSSHGFHFPLSLFACLQALLTAQVTKPQPDSQAAQDELFKLCNLLSTVLRPKVRLNSSAICAVSDTQSYGCWSHQLFQHWAAPLEKLPPTESDPRSRIGREQSSCAMKQDISIRSWCY